MAFTTAAWRSLMTNSRRIPIFFVNDAVPLRYRQFILSQIRFIGTKLRPIVKLSYFFSLVSLSKEGLLNVPPPENLSHEYLLTQASNLAAASSQQLITLTVAAIVDIAEQYRKCMEQLMCLMENMVEISANCPQGTIWDEVVAMRIKVEEQKKRLRDLSSFMEHVEKMAVGSAEVCYFAGGEHASTSMCELLNTAHVKLKDEYDKTRHLEQELLNAQKEFIEKACDVEKRLKQRECEIKEQTKAYYLSQLPKKDECKG